MKLDNVNEYLGGGVSVLNTQNCFIVFCAKRVALFGVIHACGQHGLVCAYIQKSPRLAVAGGFQVPPAVAALGVESTTPSDTSALTEIFWSGWE